MKSGKKMALGRTCLFQEISGILVRGEKGNYFRTDLCIVAGILKESDTFGGRELEAILKQALHSGPIRKHVRCPTIVTC